MQHVVWTCFTFLPSKIKIIQMVLELQSGHEIRFKSRRGNTSKSKKARVVILVCTPSSRPVLYFYKASSKYSEGYSSYRAGRISILNTRRGDNSKSKKAKVVIHLRFRSSHPVLHFYQVSSKYTKVVFGLQSGHEINAESLSNIIKGDYTKSKKGRVVIIVRDTLSRHGLHFYQIPLKYS